MASLVVTAATPDYLPGVRALANSIKTNSPGWELHCYGFDGAEGLEPPGWDVRYPYSSTWPEPPPSSFFRLRVPQLYPDDRVIWLDADAIVQAPLDELAEMQFTEPVAAIYRPDENFRLAFQVRPAPPELANVRCTCNGLLVYNAPEWNRLQITERCEAVMNESRLDFRYIDQSLLSYVLAGNWHRLDPKWLCFANRRTAHVAGAPILAWAGGVPWRDDVGNTDAWQNYA